MKKILSAALAVLMLAGSLSIAAGAQTFVNDETYVVGNVDASSDKAVNAVDVYLMRSYIVGKPVVIDKQASDLDADGSINAVDVYNLRCLLVGLKNNSDFDNGRQVYKFTIGGVDISEFVIAVPEGYTKDKNAYYAAEQLKLYIEAAVGVELAIINSGNVPKHAIVFHDVPLDSELGEHLGTEGYSYKVESGRLDVYGTYRGNMYAVYEILENYLGFRFYDNNYTFFLQDADSGYCRQNRPFLRAVS